MHDALHQRGFFAGVIARARQARLLSDEHFTVDGTLIEAWASLKSLRRKDGTPPKDGEDEMRRMNALNDRSSSGPSGNAIPRACQW